MFEWYGWIKYPGLEIMNENKIENSVFSLVLEKVLSSLDCSDY